MVLGYTIVLMAWKILACPTRKRKWNIFPEGPPAEGPGGAARTASATAAALGPGAARQEPGGAHTMRATAAAAAVEPGGERGEGMRCYQRWISKMKTENKNERNEKYTQFDLCFMMCFRSQKTKMITRSIHIFW